MKELLDLVYGFRAKEMNFNEFIGGLGAWFNDIGVGGPIMDVVSKSWFPFFAMAMGAIFLFYGRKWFGCLKFLSCAAVGFVAGLIVNPMLVGMLPFLEGKAWITGALCAMMLAVLNKLLFGIAYFGLPPVVVFAVCYYPGILPKDLPSVGNLPKCLFAAAGMLLIMLIIRSDFERIVTAIEGSLMLNYGIKRIFDYTASVPDIAPYVDLVVIAVFALIGFVYQYRRRRRYYY